MMCILYPANMRFGTPTVQLVEFETKKKTSNRRVYEKMGNPAANTSQRNVRRLCGIPAPDRGLWVSASSRCLAIKCPGQQQIVSIRGDNVTLDHTLCPPVFAPVWPVLI